MTVIATISKTSTGAQLADPLSGGGAGYDIGVVRNGSYSGVTDKATNQGAADWWISHDAVNDPLTNVALFVEPYSQTYGGVRTVGEDYTKLQTLAEATDGSKNNGSGNAGGYAVDMDYDAVIANQFDYINLGPVADSIVTGPGGGAVRYFRRTDGGSLTDEGSSLLTRIDVLSDAMAYEPGTGAIAPSAPLLGNIGKSDDTVLGNRCRLKTRLYLPEAEIEGGETQWDQTLAFTFTS